MDATCSNCNHWDTTTEAVKAQTTTVNAGFGECNELSHPKAEMHFILPVIQNGDPRNVEFITGAEFGCNHFQAAGQA